MTNHQWLLAARPEGLPGPEHFSWNEAPAAALQPGHLRVRQVLLSLDPTNRIWMNDYDSYLPKIELGQVMRGIGIGIVEQSQNPKFAAGDSVHGLLGWQSYYVGDGQGLVKLPAMPLPLEAHFGLLGHIGFTAYFGVVDIGQPKAGETVVVSGAAGAVGSLAGQVAKNLGCRVVGIAGGAAKCRWITEELGFDAAIDYKSEDVREALNVHCPNGIDVIFENVGGDILEAEMARINLKARIVLCGLISQYNEAEPAGSRAMFQLIGKRARMEGFIVTDFAPRFMEAAQKMIGWHMAGKMKYRVDTVEGLKNAPEALKKLFTGANTGKLLVRVSDPARSAG